MKFKLSILSALFAVSLVACSETPAANAASNVATKVETAGDSVKQAITQTLEHNYAAQNLKVMSVQTTPITGLYEVVLNNKQIAYTDPEGKYLVVGELIDTAAGVSLTEERQAELNRVDFKALPFDKAIKEVRGKGELKVAVFSDPDCPFCKRLEREFEKMDNITIYNFMMPIPSLHPQGQRKAEQIWCSDNPTLAWTTWMRQGKMLAGNKTCANPVAETMALGAEFGFNGTPTMVFPNGKVQSGYSPMPHLEILIKQNQ